jgi:hypothetical protein
MPTCVSPARKLPFAVGSSSQSADQITAWHANGSRNLKTLLHDTFQSLFGSRATGENGAPILGNKIGEDYAKNGSNKNLEGLAAYP